MNKLLPENWRKIILKSEMDDLISLYQSSNDFQKILDDSYTLSLLLDKWELSDFDIKSGFKAFVDKYDSAYASDRCEDKYDLTSCIIKASEFGQFYWIVYYLDKDPSLAHLAFEISASDHTEIAHWLYDNYDESFYEDTINTAVFNASTHGNLEFIKIYAVNESDILQALYGASETGNLEIIKWSLQTLQEIFPHFQFEEDEDKFYLKRIIINLISNRIYDPENLHIINDIINNMILKYPNAKNFMLYALAYNDHNEEYFKYLKLFDGNLGNISEIYKESLLASSEGNNVELMNWLWSKLKDIDVNFIDIIDNYIGTISESVDPISEENGMNALKNLINLIKEENIDLNLIRLFSLIVYSENFDIIKLFFDSGIFDTIPIKRIETEVVALYDPNDPRIFEYLVNKFSLNRDKLYSKINEGFDPFA